MGLDMYAHRRINTKHWEHQSPSDRLTVEVKRDGKPVKGLNPQLISSVEEEVMYWRKANHIHRWFVENVQEGVDNCAEYFVPMTKIANLIEVCAEVIRASKLVDGDVNAGTVYDKNHPQGLVKRTPGKVIKDASVAKRLLPTQEGFFFGCYEYDQMYLDDVIQTHEWALRMHTDYTNGNPGEIYYSSSW